MSIWPFRGRIKHLLRTKPLHIARACASHPSILCSQTVITNPVTKRKTPEREKKIPWPSLDCDLRTQRQICYEDQCANGDPHPPSQRCSPENHSHFSFASFRPLQMTCSHATNGLWARAQKNVSLVQKPEIYPDQKLPAEYSNSFLLS